MSGSCVLLVGAGGLWPAQLVTCLRGAGYRIGHPGDIATVMSLLLLDAVRAVLVPSHQCTNPDMIVLHLCRKLSPRTALVVVGDGAAGAGSITSRASWATSSLAWPASRPEVLRAIRGQRVSAGHRGRRTRPAAR